MVTLSSHLIYHITLLLSSGVSLDKYQELSHKKIVKNSNSFFCNRSRMAALLLEALPHLTTPVHNTCNTLYTALGGFHDTNGAQKALSGHVYSTLASQSSLQSSQTSARPSLIQCRFSQLTAVLSELSQVFFTVAASAASSHAVCLPLSDQVGAQNIQRVPLFPCQNFLAYQWRHAPTGLRLSLTPPPLHENFEDKGFLNERQYTHAAVVMYTAARLVKVIVQLVHIRRYALHTAVLSQGVDLMNLAVCNTTLKGPPESNLELPYLPLTCK
ncbi:hypothetical protein E2C01_040143 [Portunus trituberculatus]|uniref:Uncharacterized protein n=1 Tax=Portunus trituberculatus TaxID=210409 RepID=A0A5B7FMU5_PORTR|nr:hypothetical protein [Portunus trituberculatus]